MEFLIRVIILIGLIVGSVTIANDNLKYTFIGSAITLSSELALSTYHFVKDSGSNLMSIVLSLTIYRKKKIRLSCSYLYKIKVDDNYLLVKNSHRPSYQPVGGVYKRTAESDTFLGSLLFNEDEKLTNGKSCNKDLRIHIKGKNLKEYINWYNKNKEREISHLREFYEELLSNNILDPKVFPYPSYVFKKRVFTPLKWSKVFQCYELLIYDILELTPSETQLCALRELHEQGDTDYIKWADANTIRSKGFNSAKRIGDYEIGDHTTLLIDFEYSKKYMS